MAIPFAINTAPTQNSFVKRVADGIGYFTLLANTYKSKNNSINFQNNAIHFSGDRNSFSGDANGKLKINEICNGKTAITITSPNHKDYTQEVRIARGKNHMGGVQRQRGDFAFTECVEVNNG